jgi:hypothetical protein
LRTNLAWTECSLKYSTTLFIKIECNYGSNYRSVGLDVYIGNQAL